MDNLGIVLLNMGGPTSLDAVRPFEQGCGENRLRLETVLAHDVTPDEQVVEVTGDMPALEAQP